jgi:hypothetical protein
MTWYTTEILVVSEIAVQIFLHEEASCILILELGSVNPWFSSPSEKIYISMQGTVANL